MPQSFLSTNQVDAEKATARDARQFFNLSSLFHESATARSGFGSGGPAVALTERRRKYATYTWGRHDEAPVSRNTTRLILLLHHLDNGRELHRVRLRPPR
ncbi:MAG: hypothetical protein PPHEINF_6197 [uncultured Paraburkholderia sp.]|nr:MAG: hypothetical protein PPHEINF_6197 [uncultured Paraburkholderia sp.]